MLEAAGEQLGLDLAASFLVGNHPTDVGAAVAAGVTPLFVATGAAAGRSLPGLPAFADLQAAAAAVIERSGRTTRGCEAADPGESTGLAGSPACMLHRAGTVR